VTTDDSVVCLCQCVKFRVFLFYLYCVLLQVSLIIADVCRCRGKTVKLVDSRPLQIAMCVLVLFDAAVVVAEILLDMHAIRSQLSLLSSRNY